MNMNQKGFANIALVLVIIAIVAVGGYFVFIGKTSTPTQPLPPSEKVTTPTPSPALDTKPVPTPSPALDTKPVTPAQGSKLPDLVIDSISYKRYQPPPPGPGEPQGVVLMDNAFEFTVRIKNIGDASFNHSFYLENTRSSYDLSVGHYSHGELINQQQTVLNPNGTMEIKIIDSIDSNVHKVGFLIATDGKPHLKGAYPKIGEKNYNNNSYELQIP